MVVLAHLNAPLYHYNLLPVLFQCLLWVTVLLGFGHGTGDMQLTKREIEETQVIVTTPEKWDVITRKASDSSLIELVKLLIIDEVHLLADERGAVLESIVARTLRMVEASQSHVRIVGLSATLPNYKDVALFLNANLHTGLFHFGPAYR